LVGWARIDRDTHARSRAVAPRAASERALQRNGGREGGGCVGECRAHAIAGVLEQAPAAVGDRTTRDRVVAREGVRHRGGGVPPQAGGPPPAGGEERPPLRPPP